MTNLNDIDLGGELSIIGVEMEAAGVMSGSWDVRSGITGCTEFTVSPPEFGDCPITELDG